MYPKTHVIFGFIFSFILFVCFSEINLFFAILIFLSSFLVDIDHYFFRAWKLNQKNIFKAYKSNLSEKQTHNNSNKEKRKRVIPGFYIFHGFETLIILFLLGFFIHKLFYFILIGVLFHLCLDYLEMVFNQEKMHKFSSIIDYLSFEKANKNFKK